MNSLKKELKAAIENQNKFNEEISAMKVRIEALESKKDNNVEVQIDNLMEGIQYQRDVIQNKLAQIDASIKKIDEELEALTSKLSGQLKLVTMLIMIMHQFLRLDVENAVLAACKHVI